MHLQMYKNYFYFAIDLLKRCKEGLENLLSANFVATQQRKMHFSLHSLLQNLEDTRKMPIFAGRTMNESSFMGLGCPRSEELSEFVATLFYGW